MGSQNIKVDPFNLSRNFRSTITCNTHFRVSIMKTTVRVLVLGITWGGIEDRPSWHWSDNDIRPVVDIPRETDQHINHLNSIRFPCVCVCVCVCANAKRVDHPFRPIRVSPGIRLVA